MAAELRDDIAAAKAKLQGGSFGSGRALKRLPEHLAEGERVVAVASGSFGGGVGLLALTDRRLLFVREGVLQKALEDFPLDRVSSVAWASGIVMGKIFITVAGNRAEIDGVVKSDGKRFVDEAREAMASAGSAASAGPAPAADHAAQLLQLKSLLDADVLTPQEYETKKAEILARM